MTIISYVTGQCLCDNKHFLLMFTLQAHSLLCQLIELCKLQPSLPLLKWFHLWQFHRDVVNYSLVSMILRWLLAPCNLVVAAEPCDHSIKYLNDSVRNWEIYLQCYSLKKWSIRGMKLTTHLQVAKSGLCQTVWCQSAASYPHGYCVRTSQGCQV